MFSLYNIVSDILYSVAVGVDFLGTHMTNLVLFLKPGVTNMSKEEKSNSRLIWSIVRISMTLSKKTRCWSCLVWSMAAEWYK
jgi:hypothetical protein